MTIIRPKSPAQSEFGQLDAGPTGAAATPLYRASGSFNLPRFGIAIAALEVEVAPHLAGRYYSCLRPAAEPLPPEAYSLACQGFSSWSMVTPEASDARVRLVAISTVPEGSYAQTVGMQAAAVAERVSSFGFSLSFDGRDPGSQGFGTGFSYDQRP